jgi:DNA-binding XRE family transcriptional regulator
MNVALGICGTCRKYGLKSCGHYFCDDCTLDGTDECNDDVCTAYYGMTECDWYEADALNRETEDGENIYGHIGRQIAKYRNEKGMTQKELAWAYSVSEFVISSFENGSNGITIHALYKIADILGKPVSDFLP